MGVARGVVIATCLAAGGCFPRESQTIGAIDPMSSIPAIQRAAETKNQNAVPALVVQLNNDDPAIRFYAFEALQRITGQTFDYRFFDDVDQRRPAIERWKRWLKQRKT
jgi:hypothetical protein